MSQITNITNVTLVDSGFSCHIISEKDLLTEIKTCVEDIKVAKKITICLR